MEKQSTSGCPKCGSIVVSTAHGDYCPKPECKWGWEVEMDGSPLKPPILPTEEILTVLKEIANDIRQLRVELVDIPAEVREATLKENRRIIKEFQEGRLRY